MNHAIALDLIAAGIEKGETWADLGAGSGTFSFALAELVGPKGHIISLDSQPGFTEVEATQNTAQIEVLKGDLREDWAFSPLDGILMANVLHYFRKASEVLHKVQAYLKPGGKFMVIEYDQNIPNPWVPFPISRKKGNTLLSSAGFEQVQEIGHTQSRYGNGEIYALMGVK